MASAAALAVGFVLSFYSGTATRWLQFGCVGASYAQSGLPQAVSSASMLLEGKIDQHLLMVLAAVGALYLGFPMEVRYVTSLPSCDGTKSTSCS